MFVVILYLYLISSWSKIQLILIALLYWFPSQSKAPLYLLSLVLRPLPWEPGNEATPTSTSIANQQVFLYQHYVARLNIIRKYLNVVALCPHDVCGFHNVVP